MTGFALARAELIRALTAYTGIATADGDPAGTTLIDRALIGRNDFLSGKRILIMSGDAALEDRGIASFDDTTGEITLVSAVTDQITAGTIFRVLNMPSVDPELSEILSLLGNTQGLCYYGLVTAILGPNEFAIDSLIGLGDAKFIDPAGAYPYYAYVLRDASGPGAAPQGEARRITLYSSATGGFLTDAFSSLVAVGDEILIIHPFLARIMNLAGLAPHTGTATEDWNAAEADIVQIGAANTRYKLHSLLLNISALVGTVTIRMYQEIVGVERQVYSGSFTVAADGPGLWIVNGTVAIHEVLRVTAQSDNAGDDGKSIDYDYMLEAM